MASKTRKRKASWKVLENFEEESKSKELEKKTTRSRSCKTSQSVGNDKQAEGKGRRKKSTAAQKMTDGKGKGKGSKGKGKTKDKTEQECLTDLRRQRKKKIQEEVNNLTVERAKELLCLAAERDPSILHLVEAAGQGAVPEEPAPRPPDVPGWCICHHCSDMPTDLEKECCRRNPENCMSESLDVANLVLDPLVLYIFRMYRGDVFAMGILDEGDLNRQNRHAAYRCYILWQYGRLRSGDRRVIPSCVVWKIRERYPDPINQYRGFIRGRLG